MKPRVTLVLDNGASTIKANVIEESASSFEQPRYAFRCSFATYANSFGWPLKYNVCSHRIITNAIVSSKGDKKLYCGHEFAGCRDHSSLHFRLPFEKVRIHASCRMNQVYWRVPSQSLGLLDWLGCAKDNMGRRDFTRSAWSESPSPPFFYQWRLCHKNIAWLTRVVSPGSRMLCRWSLRNRRC